MHVSVGVLSPSATTLQRKTSTTSTFFESKLLQELLCRARIPSHDIVLLGKIVFVKVNHQKK